MQTKGKNDILGIDVSHHQGNIDWLKVARDNVGFAYVKASEGAGFVDSQFRRNAGGANAVGIPVGFYHYARPEKANTAVEEAAHFVDVTKGQACQLPYCLDLEGEAAKLSTADLTAWAIAFMREVKRLTKKAVILYTGAYFARDELGKAAGEFPLWVAHYGVASGSTPLPNNTWNEWAAWQFTSSGKVDGIAGNVDLDYMDADYFAALFEQSALRERGEDYKMKKADADKVIALLSAAHGLTGVKDARDEIHRLANELRKASGQPTT